MWTKREVIIFLAGVEAFHALSHVAMSVSGALPMRFFGFTVTAGLNALGIVVNAAMTVLLLWWVSRLSRE